MGSVPKALKLNTGDCIPSVGFGVYQSPPGKETNDAVRTALKVGYRHVDTAQVYRNEADVGRAVVDSGLPRSDIFVTTKVWKSNWGYEPAKASVERSLKTMGLDYVDLILLHAPGEPATRADTWRALEDARKQGLVRNIGVSNFGSAHLEKLAKTATVPPSVNQIEVHPWLQRRELVQYCKDKGIVVEAYSPLARGQKLSDPKVGAIAKKHNRTPAQVLIRWSLQKGLVPLPKSVNADRIASNFDVFSFELPEDDMAALDQLEENLITGWDPVTQDPV